VDATGSHVDIARAPLEADDLIIVPLWLTWNTKHAHMVPPLKFSSTGIPLHAGIVTTDFLLSDGECY
jgi:hypothetical protein